MEEVKVMIRIGGDNEKIKVHIDMMQYKEKPKKIVNDADTTEDTETLNTSEDGLEVNEESNPKDKKSKGKKKSFKTTQVANVSNHIAKKVTEVTVANFAYMVAKHGHVFCASIFSEGARKNKNWKSQKLFAIDIDNEDVHGKPLPLEDALSIEQFYERCEEYDIIPAFMYESYSSTKENPRFRAVFICDIIITDDTVADIMRKMLLDIFPEADQNCKDAARMFYGSNKGPIYKKFLSRITITDFARALEYKIYSQDSSKYAENLRVEAQKLGVETEIIGRKTYLAISESTIDINIPRVEVSAHCCAAPHSHLDSEEIRENPSNNTMGNSLNSPIIINDGNTQYSISLIKNGISNHSAEGGAERSDASPLSSCICETIIFKSDRRENILKRLCPLLAKFMSDSSSLSHMQRCVLLASLIYVKGGETIFSKYLKENHDKYKYEAKRFKKYHPWGCEKGNCPYFENCGGPTPYARFSSKIIPTGEESEYISNKDVDKAFDDMRNRLMMTLEYKENKIYLMIAQTALGKTTAYYEAVKSRVGTDKKPILIAVPSHDLQAEVVQRLLEIDRDTVSTINLLDMLRNIELGVLSDSVQWLYEKGRSDKVRSLLHAYVKEHKEKLTQNQMEALNKYFKQHKMIEIAQHTVVTTHSMLFLLPEEILRKYEIIVDEDPLMTIFKNTQSVSFDKVKCAIVDGLLPDLELFRNLMGTNIPNEYTIPMNLGEYPKEYQKSFEKSAIDWNVPSFYEARSICVVNRRKDDRRFYYFTPSKLPNVKMTIMSATADESVYRSLYGPRVDCYRIPLVELKGRLIQYTYDTMSRACIDKLDFNKIMNVVHKITGNPHIPVITFKGLDPDQSEIYFGKVEGFNKYSGKDIAVIGTNHSLPCVYKLIGAYLGFDTSSPRNNYKITYNGYDFTFSTYKDENMRNLHLYFINTEAEQAVGRARLLRKDCTVYLFSNFPLMQAELRQMKIFDSGDNGDSD